MSDILVFAILPYLAMGVFLVMTIQRYRQRTFTYSSLSSQFLENRRHFWGSVPFHYGLLFVLALHVAAAFLPGTVLAWNAAPTRLFVLESTALAMAVLALVGLVNIVTRRLADPKARVVTSPSDWIVHALLGVQIVTGIGVAVLHGWGSSWFAASLAPWIRSLFLLQPELVHVQALPWLVKLHVANAWLLIGFFPFTRLVHVLVIPNPYLWRRTQLVIWNTRRKGGRSGSPNRGRR